MNEILQVISEVASTVALGLPHTQPQLLVASAILAAVGAAAHALGAFLERKKAEKAAQKPEVPHEAIAPQAQAPVPGKPDNH